MKYLQLDGSVRVLHQFATLLRKSGPVDVVTSASRVAVVGLHRSCIENDLYEQECTPDRLEIRQAQLDGPSTRVELCNDPAHDLLIRGLDISDDAVAYIGCNADDANALVVRDLVNPAASPLVVPPPSGQAFESVRLAGRYVAAQLPPRRVRDKVRGPVLVVYDRLSRTELYRARDYTWSDHSFALQDDGTVVVERNAADGGSAGNGCAGLARLTLYSPAEPFPHELPERPCYPGVEIAGGRILYEAFPGGGRGLSQLALTSPDGSSPLLAADTSLSGQRAYDFDSNRVAYTDDTCTRFSGRLVITDLADLDSGGYRPADTCPMHLARTTPVVERRNGVLAVKVRCSRGCSGDVVARPLGRRRPWWGIAFSAPPGQVKTVTGIRLFLNSEPRNAIVRRRIAIVVSAYQPDGSDVKLRVVRRLRVSLHG